LFVKVSVRAIMLFGRLAGLGLGIIGQYVWLCLQNSRNRPSYIVASQQDLALPRALSNREFVLANPWYS
jgi:hypothetical protein